MDLLATDVPARPVQRSVTMLRDATAIVTAVDDVIVEVLGWLPDELLGRPSTRLIHPEDQNSAVAAWFEMISAPDETRIWRGRYQSADGPWVWVETVNHNGLSDPRNPVVTTTMTLVEGEQVSVEERLRVREQVLSRLSDALPVGLFQFDTVRRVTFTNDRLHAIVPSATWATVDGLFESVTGADAPALDTALTTVLADRPVDDLEIGFGRPPGEADEDGAPALVCMLSLRALTDREGAVTGGIGCLSDVTEQVLLRRQLERRANTDALTSCLNRSATLESLSDALRSTSAGSGTAVVFIDLDRFKDVNDQHGHAAGDLVLQETSQRLMAAVRRGDDVGRIGGDEFLVVCSDVGSPGRALEMAGRLAASIASTVRLGDLTFALRASVGVAWTDEPLDADALVARADRAMYANKATKLEPAALFTEPLPSR